MLGASTLNVGTISGGRAPNVVADEARAEIMFRTVGDPAPLREGVAAVGHGPRGSARSLAHARDSLDGFRRLADHGRGVHHGHSGVGRGLGQTVPDRAGQHSRGAHRGRAHLEERIVGSGGDLHADGDASFLRRRRAKACGRDEERAERRRVTLGLAIVGYGKMGRLIEQLAPEYGFDVRAKFDSKNNAGGDGLTREALQRR